MEIKVLVAQQHDNSGFKVLRAYIESDYEQADQDREMLIEHSDKNITLHTVQLHGNNNVIVKVIER